MSHVATGMSELARFLIAMGPFATHTPDVASLHRRACRAYVEEMLTSEDAATTYHWDNNTSTRLVRRTSTHVPPVVRDVMFPLILDRAEAMLSLPMKSPLREDEFEAILTATQFTMAPYERARVAADLLQRLRGLSSWDDGHRASLSWIRVALRGSEPQPTVDAICIALRAWPAKESWTANGELVKTLARAPGAPGTQFTRMFVEQIGAAALVTAPTHGYLVSALVRDVEGPRDLLERFAPLVPAAKVALVHGHAAALGGWATFAAAVFKRVEAWCPQAEPAEMCAVLDSLEIWAFTDRMASPGRLTSARADGSNFDLERAVDTVLRSWLSMVKRVAIACPGVFAAAAVPRLLSVIERQHDFESVRNLLESIITTGITHHQPDVVLDCLSVCIDEQDLDGITLLLEGGVTAVGPLESDGSQSFLIEALARLWNAGDWQLAVASLNRLSRELPAAQRASLDNTARKLAPALASRFPRAPRLTFEGPGVYAHESV
jgi:hypothetical protein